MGLISDLAEEVSRLAHVVECARDNIVREADDALAAAEAALERLDRDEARDLLLAALLDLQVAYRHLADAKATWAQPRKPRRRLAR